MEMCIIDKLGNIQLLCPVSALMCDRVFESLESFNGFDSFPLLTSTSDCRTSLPFISIELLVLILCNVFKYLMHVDCRVFMSIHNCPVLKNNKTPI
jgi:hypothetical protein